MGCFQTQKMWHEKNFSQCFSWNLLSDFIEATKITSLVENIRIYQKNNICSQKIWPWGIEKLFVVHWNNFVSIYGSLNKKWQLAIDLETDEFQ